MHLFGVLEVASSSHPSTQCVNQNNTPSFLCIVYSPGFRYLSACGELYKVADQSYNAWPQDHLLL